MTNDNNVMNKLLKETVEKKGSDLHLVTGARPSVRINGSLISQEYPILSGEDIERLVYSMIEPNEIESFETNLELDFSYSIAGVARFRGNLMRQRGTIAAVFRVVPYNIPDFETLGLPEHVKGLCNLMRGLILVTGPTGSGKSTTLAAMINEINKTRSSNIVTIEDPIEFLHKHQKATIRQREIGIDTHSFGDALKHVLRHDPDIILVGEMRDLESISIALTAAETGHLVLSTLHTQTAPLTISRIIDVFDSARREQIRQQLANTLRAVVSQQLIPTADGKGRVVAVEFMSDTPGIRNLIREGREHQLYTAIQTGHSAGMQTMDYALLNLFNKHIISRESALEYAIEVKEMQRMLGVQY
jgi:twitching motility protein PilT